jgi:hypothetical protein
MILVHLLGRCYNVLENNRRDRRGDMSRMLQLQMLAVAFYVKVS